MENTIMALLFLSVLANAKAPDWAARNSTKLTGQILTTVCHGTGPSLDIARNEALKSCQSSASQFFKSKIRIKSLSVETEKSVGFHQEIMNDDEIEGLNCDPQRDQIDEAESQFSVWLECTFDLNKVSSRPIEEKSELVNKSDLSTLELSKVKVAKDILIKNVFISTIPKCESVIIRGANPRTIQCSENPMRIQVKDDDSLILIRAKGYKSKALPAKGLNANETIQVLLDLL